MVTKQRVEQLFKRLNKLNTQGIKVYLDMITDRVNTDLYFRIRAVDRLGKVIEEETFTDVPRKYLDRYSDKYNITAEVQLYDKINGELVLHTLDKWDVKSII